MPKSAQLIRDVYVPAGLILAANIGGFLHILPVFVQLLINSSAVVYIGCIMSCKLRKN
jgi:hypothetical protein